ncbi:MAG: ArdC-like ssDNA-binding domain-containing protein [Candidatus Magasanikbacteria bacterium]
MTLELTQEQQKEDLTNYKGSETTREMVREQIRERWGDEAAEKYDPYVNVRTFREWKELGYHVKEGADSIKSYTYVTVEDEETGEEETYRKPVHLFCWKQVKKIEEDED